MPELNKRERDLLLMLAHNNEATPYGECYGTALTSLMIKGLAKVHFARQASQQFSLEGKGLMSRAVALTDDGIALARRLKESA
jgi:hypothetical protein